MSTKFTGPLLNRDRSDRSDTDTRKWFSNLPIGQEPDYAVYMNDFLSSQEYAAADWVITEVDTDTDSGESRVITGDDGANGILVVTNNDNAADLTSMQMSSDGGTTALEAWQLQSGKKLWMKMRVALNDADQVDFFAGLCVTDTSPLDATDRVGFQVNDGDASILCKSEKDSTETSSDSGVDAADATYNELAIYWDGVSTCRFFVDDNQVAIHTSNNPDDEAMAVTVHLKNGEAAAQSVSVDYIYVCQER